jgi:hypothetical protein
MHPCIFDGSYIDCNHLFITCLNTFTYRISRYFNIFIVFNRVMLAILAFRDDKKIFAIKYPSHYNIFQYLVLAYLYFLYYLCLYHLFHYHLDKITRFESQLYSILYRHFLSVLHSMTKYIVGILSSHLGLTCFSEIVYEINKST